jgi:septum site-determining protein MinC
MSMQRAAVSIKGTKSGLQIVLDSAMEFDLVRRELSERVAATDSFFHGSRVALDVGQREVTREQWAELDALLRQENLVLTAALADQEETRAAARSFGIPLVTESKRDVAAGERRRHGPGVEGGHEGLFLRRTLRSGQVVRCPGSLLVLGDVNAGAEVVAEGDVIVWGSLRGVVHAGAGGSEAAVICALHLSPTQLRLAGRVARSAGERTRLVAGPELARIQGDHIIVDEWVQPRLPVRVILPAFLLVAAVAVVQALAVAVLAGSGPLEWRIAILAAAVLASVGVGWLALLWAFRRAGGGR